MLNLFSYTGGFGVHALLAGADRVVNVDASHEALELAERNIKLNDLDEDQAPSSFRRTCLNICGILPKKASSSTWWCATRPSSPTARNRSIKRRAATKI